MENKTECLKSTQITLESMIMELHATQNELQSEKEERRKTEEALEEN